MENEGITLWPDITRYEIYEIEKIKIGQRYHHVCF